MRYLILLLLILSTGCASTISTPATLSDAVYYTSEPVAKTVNFTYSTAAPDESIKPVGYNKKGERASGGGLKIDVRHNDALERMYWEYLSSTFNGPGSDVQVELRLMEVELRADAQDGAGKTFLVAMAGGELSSIMSARQRAKMTVRSGGKTYEKLLVGTASTQDVDGIGTGTSSSHIYKGANSDEMIYGRLLNDSSNKLILQSAQFLRSLEL